MQILLATTNPGKLREIRDILAGVPVELVTLDTFPTIPEPEEHGRSFSENARLKALHYAQATGIRAVADDSGLEIDALDGAPGVHSARFGGPDTPYPDKFTLIYEALRARPCVPRTARFVCAVALAEGNRIVFEGRGTIEGVIADAPRGQGGFGYDPIFFCPPLGLTLAQISRQDKSAVSHRGEAFRKLRAYLELATTQR